MSESLQKAWMSRLHRIDFAVAEVADHFGADVAGCAEPDDEVVEGRFGLVVIKAKGGRVVKRLRWGFPRLTSEMMARGDRPQRLGLVADLTSPMWDRTVADPRYRCLVALSAFANPDGPKGAKTRTWFSVRGRPLVAWAGFCRNTTAFGPVFAGMTTMANAAVMATNNRMPVLLGPGEWDRWLNGSIDDVIRFQFRGPIAAERMETVRTRSFWGSGASAGPAPQLALL